MTGEARSTVVPLAGETVTPSTVVKVGASAVRSVPRFTGRTTERVVLLTIGAIFSADGSLSDTSMSWSSTPALPRISVADSARLYTRMLSYQPWKNASPS